MNHKTSDSHIDENANLLVDLPETIAKNAKQLEREKSKKMRRYFEKKREQDELNKQLEDPFDSYDLDE